MSLNRSSHPLVAHKLAILRDKTTEPKQFRELVRELTWLLGYEAMADLATRPEQIETPLEPMTAARLEPRVGLIPILRAGLGMVDAMLELLPTAEVWHIGLYRDERTLKPVEYYNKLPDAATVQVCLILDPMLATGGSSAATVDILKQWGAARIKQVSLIAAPEGVADPLCGASGCGHPRRGDRLAPQRARLHRARPRRRRRPAVRHLRRPGLGAGPWARRRDRRDRPPPAARGRVELVGSDGPPAFACPGQGLTSPLRACTVPTGYITVE